MLTIRNMLGFSIERVLFLLIALKFYTDLSQDNFRLRHTYL